MATIRYLIQSKSDNAQIFLRLTLNKSLQLKRKTGIFINSNNWSRTTGLPKNNDSTNKQLITSLRKLKDNVQDQVNDANINGTIIDGDWLSYHIDLFFNRISINNQSELVTDAIQHLINNAHLRENSKGGIGLTKSRVQAYSRLSSLFSSFQGKSQLKVKELDKYKFEEFKKWLLDESKYSHTYTFKKLSDLKTVCKDARSNGIQTSHDINDIKTKQVSAYDADMDVITLSLEEIDKIENTHLISEAHINARKWLIIGVFSGQRGNDLLNRIDSKSFHKHGENLVIKLIQQKGNKPVIIPVLPKVLKIYKEGLPYSISIQKLNKYIKEIGKIARINEMVLGRVQDKKTKRGVKKLRPKYKYLRSHIFRRSFCSNFYGKIPTPLLMKISNHKKEASFLTYINQTDDSHVDAFIEYFKTKKIIPTSKNQTV
jgi:hypothetical protein